MWSIQTIAYDGTVRWYEYDASTMNDERFSAMLADFHTMVRTREIERFSIA
jgi:hypothetical protein